MLVFFLSKHTPGDPLDKFVDEDLSINESYDDKQSRRLLIAKDLGLDKPVFYFEFRKNEQNNYPIIPKIKWNGFNNQYHRWFTNFILGDFGKSYFDRLPIRSRISSPLKWTLLINLISILLAYLISIPLGVYSADRKGALWEKSTNLFLYFLYSIPGFWLATLLITFLASQDFLQLFPAGGISSFSRDASFISKFLNVSWHLALPIFCTTYVAFAFITKQVKASMLNSLNADYIKTAKVKGLSKNKVLWKHGLRNSLFPLITLFSYVFPATIAGSVIIEIIFSIPGMGRLAYEGLLQQDWPLVYTIAMMGAILTLIGNLISDIIYACADPRVQLNNQNS